MNSLTKIKTWIDKHVPKTVMLKAGDERVLLSVYTYMQLPKPELVEAVQRIQAQMPFYPDGNTHEYLVYEADKKALADMCNDYCILLSDAYQYYPGWAKEQATDNYKRCTELFIQLQS
jgi:hypothetical protein